MPPSSSAFGNASSSPAAWRLLSFAALAWLLVRLLETLRAGNISTHDSFLLGATLALAACALFLQRPRTSMVRRSHLILTTLAVLLGILARTLYLDTFPPPDGQLWEECQTATVALKSVQNSALDEYFPIPNLIAESGFRVLGSSLDAVRAPFVAVGILSLPLFFLAARSLVRTFGAALAATLLFASSAYLAAASRVALETMSPIATLSLALAATFYAVRHRSLASFAMTGIGCGFLMLEYISFKLCAPLLIATLLASAAASPIGITPLTRKPSWSVAALYGYRWHLALLAFGFLAVTTTVLIHAPDTPIGILAEGVLRQRRALAGNGLTITWADWAEAGGARIATSFRFFFLPNTSTDLMPQTFGVVDRYTGFASLAALLYCTATARRDARRLFLPTAIVLTIALAGLLVDNPARYRLTPLPPLCFLALAVPIDDALVRLRGTARAAKNVIAAAVLFLVAVNLHTLFAVAMKDPAVLAEFADLRLMIGREIAAAQRIRPTDPIYLATDHQAFDRANDFSFLYDFEYVTALDHPDQIRDHSTGLVVATEPYIDAVESAPNTTSCRLASRLHGNRRLQWLTCRLGQTPGGTLATQSDE